VSCGTTPFPSMVKSIFSSYDELADYEVIIQEITLNESSFKNISSVKLYDCADEFFLSADIAVVHAGAGTVFNLLKKGLKLVVVPNLDRKDKHQIELADYLHENDYAEVCYDLSRIHEHMNICVKRNYFRFNDSDICLNDFLSNFLGLKL
jgi:beta-1,4-N-acetylglucosaminyltransferase